MNAERATNARCPSELALERHLLDPATSGLRPHLESCPRCGERVATMEREGEEFRRFVYPATVDAVQDAAAPARGRRWGLALAPLAAAAAAAVVLLLQPSGGPGPDYLGTKGFAFQVFAGGPSGARAVASGESVPAAGALRFQVGPGRPCRLWVVSVDASGQVSRLFPAEGEGGALVEKQGPLPGGAVLDGRAGPERIYAVCTPSPLPFAEVEKAARAAAGGGPGSVRAAGGLRGLPAGTSQATLLLEKRP